MSATWTQQTGRQVTGTRANRTRTGVGGSADGGPGAGGFGAGGLGGVRLTRRGRGVVLLAAVLLLLTAFSLGRVASSAADTATGSGAGGAQYATVVVEPGDTLWSVAQQWAPEADPREVVEQIRRVNDLRGSSIRAGQQLLLPARAA